MVTIVTITNTLITCPNVATQYSLCHFPWAESLLFAYLTANERKMIQKKEGVKICTYAPVIC